MPKLNESFGASIGEALGADVGAEVGKAGNCEGTSFGSPANEGFRDAGGESMMSMLSSRS